jgi:putative transposase
MYSYEDRIRAVKLYIKLGKRTGATIRQLGYPTKNSLKSWHAEYERCLDLPRGYENSNSKYSLAQREKAVGHYLEYGRNIAATIKALGYPARDSLRAWIYEMHPELHTRIVGRSDGLARPQAVKQAAVIALCTRKESAKALAQKLGVCRPTLYNWKTSYSAQRYPHT